MSVTTPPIPTSDSARLSTLSRYPPVVVAPGDEFDAIARVAAAVCGASTAGIALVGEHRPWFAQAAGCEIRELPPGWVLSAGSGGPPGDFLVVADASADPRLAGHPAVRGEPHIRFFAGVPLVTPEGLAFGTLIVLDRQACRLTAGQQKSLRALGGLVVSQLELRRTLTDLAVRLETAQRFVHIGDWCHDLRENRPDWSEEMFRILGLSRDSADPRTIDLVALAHPDDVARVRAFDAALRAGESPGPIEYRIVRPSGEIRNVRTRAEVERDAQGAVARVVGTTQDVTEYRRAQAAAQESEMRYRLVSRATSDVLWDWDLVTNNLWRSDGFKTVFGFSTDEIKPVIDWWSGRLHPDDHDRVVSSLHQAIETGRESWAEEYRFRLKDGSYALVQDRGSILRDARGRATRMVGGMTDLTERTRLEAQYLRAQRMESVGTLAGGIAHDLNNVLAPILMSIDLLLLDAAKDPRRLRILETIRASAQRGSNLVRQVLSFARGLEGQRIAVNLGHLVDDLERIVKETFPRTIRMEVRVPSELWLVVGDATQLHQVLMNLAVNARDAMPSGGTLSIAADNLEIDAQYASTCPDARPGPHVMLEVADTGMGMPPEVRDRIFEPFFTTKEVGKGTGLGLSTVHAIIKSHGGFVTVASKVGQGSAFKVFLPADPTLPPTSRGASPLEMLRGHGELVLVVDDEASIRGITRQTLEAFGYQVLTASDGAEAVAVFAQHKDKVAAVLIDMAMPVLDGPVAIQALLRIRASARIIAVSGLASNVSVNKAAVAGAKDFLPKPYSAEALLKMLRLVLERPEGDSGGKGSPRRSE